MAKVWLYCVPCEITRLPGRIKNMDSGYYGVPACKYRNQNPVAHQQAALGLSLLGAGACALAGVLPGAVVLGAIALVKLRVVLRNKS